MKWRDWPVEWGLDSLKIDLKAPEMRWRPTDMDRNVPWDLDIELRPRITTQPVAPGTVISRAPSAASPCSD
jgi:hypothetical protein